MAARVATTRRHHTGPLLGRERVGALNELLEASERRRLTSPVRPVGPDEIADPHGPFEPPAQCCVHTNLLPSRGTVSGLVPLHIDVSRRADALCDNRASRSHSGTRSLDSILSPREDENSRANGRFPGTGPLFGGRTQGIVRRSARTLESGRLMVVTSALPGGTRPRIAGTGRLAVVTNALAGERRPRIGSSARLTVGTDALARRRRARIARSDRLAVGTNALAGGRRPRTPASGRLTVGTDALAGGRRPRTAASGRLMSDSSGLTGRS